MRADLSALSPAEATSVPSRLNATSSTDPVCPRSTRRSLPSLVRQTRTSRSSPAVTTRLPSGLKTARSTRPPCGSVRTSSPPGRQSRALPSSLAVSTSLPFGLKLASVTGFP